MLTLLCTLAVLGATAAPAAGAPRVAEARIERIDTAVAILHDVRVRLAWVPGAASGELSLQAERVDAPDLGYHYRDLRWQCPLQRGDNGAWRCDGPLRSGNGRPFRLAVAFDPQRTDARLSQGRAALELHRRASTPDLTTIDLARVPLAWAQALLAQAWPEAQLQAGSLDGELQVRAPEGQPLHVAGTLALAGAGFDTPDASIAGQGIGGRFAIDYRSAPAFARVDVEGGLLGGEFLAGNGYVALPATPVQLRVQGNKPANGNWNFPAFAWHDGATLEAEGSLALGAGNGIDALDLRLHSADIAPLRDRYLSGWLGLAGLSGLEMSGAFDLDLRLSGGRLQQANARLHDIDLTDERGRFRFEGLEGTPRFSAGTTVDSTLAWRGGQLYELPFDGVVLPLRSGNGELRLREAVDVRAFGGNLHFDDLVLRPPAAGEGMSLQFAMALDRLDIGQIAQALQLPAFEGELSGRIPTARYQDQRLDFDGGLDVQLFGGTVQVSSLALERPFGVAPSLTADLVLDDIDLQAFTGVFDFGSIAGKLDGRIADLRLVDWTPTAFDAELHTDREAARRDDVDQRISQRAVQNISSVGDSSFVGSLQGRLIGLFDDFGYRRIGIACRLANEVCEMSGLEPAPPTGQGSGPGFTIVEGAGLPRLTVVGYNRLVDWPTLLERLEAAGKGEVAPVVQ
ncbi:MAG: hypothetical protein M3Y70_04350 [Pseudomonadota bacterium]|nr:hypothetical protein [Pseudomonadota bacterium]